jgi:hypothetical protein
MPQGRYLAATLLGIGIALSGPTTKQSWASPITLSDLIAQNGSVQVGNLIFSQFSYAPTGQMPTASNVTVNTYVDASGNAGLHFGGGFTDAYDGSGATQQASDAVLSFRVAAVGGLLDAVQLSGNPQVLGPGNGVVSVTENFQAGKQPVQMSIYNAINNGVSSQNLQDAASFAPVQSLQVVTKDIFAFNQGGFPTISVIDQTFSTTPIPEPGTIFLVGMGSLALAAHRRRCRRVAAQRRVFVVAGTTARGDNHRQVRRPFRRTCRSRSGRADSEDLGPGQAAHLDVANTLSMVGTTVRPHARGGPPRGRSIEGKETTRHESVRREHPNAALERAQTEPVHRRPGLGHAGVPPRCAGDGGPRDRDPRHPGRRGISDRARYARRRHPAPGGDRRRRRHPSRLLPGHARRG